jgi:hypothetical protein
MKFHTTILQTGKTACGIEVPPEVVEGLGAGKKPPVKVTINGFTYRSSIAVMGGKFMVGVSAENRAGAGVEGGDSADIEIVVDTEPREVEVPEDLAAALSKEQAAQKFFEGLSYSKKSWFVLWITGTKNPDTRQKRLNEAIEMLKAGKSQK